MRRGPGLRPRERHGGASSTTSTANTATPTSDPSTTRPCSTPRSRWSSTRLHRQHALVGRPQARLRPEHHLSRWWSSFTQYIKQFFEPVSLLAQRYTVLQSAMSGAERIFKLLDETASRARSSAARRPATEQRRAGHPAEGEVVALENVTFAYKPGVPGAARGLVPRARAASGSPSSGPPAPARPPSPACSCASTTSSRAPSACSGRDVRSYDRRELRDLVLGGAPGRLPVRRHGRLERRHERRRSRPRAGRAGAVAAIGALDLFLRRPGGLEARVDERGANFSAGERQLLAFARALYSDTPILILDEATASIDSDTEARLQAALEAVMAGRTALVIAHRLSTIRAVDRIVVFHRGRHRGGGHATSELLAQGGVYARLYRLQFAQEARVLAEACGRALTHRAVQGIRKSTHQDDRSP